MNERGPNFIRIFLIAFLAYPLFAFGGDPGAYVDKPDLVGSISSALKASKIDHLTPRTYEHKKKQYSYHLGSVKYLGTIKREGERYILATAFFLRSSARGSGIPPARGHGFLLCLSPDFRLVSHCRLDSPGQVSLDGTSLKRGEKEIGDLSSKDARARKHGFLIDGGDFLGYPFLDRIVEKAED